MAAEADIAVAEGRLTLEIIGGNNQLESLRGQRGSWVAAEKQRIESQKQSCENELPLEIAEQASLFN